MPILISVQAMAATYEENILEMANALDLNANLSPAYTHTCTSPNHTQVRKALGREHYLKGNCRSVLQIVGPGTNPLVDSNGTMLGLFSFRYPYGTMLGFAFVAFFTYTYIYIYIYICTLTFVLCFCYAIIYVLCFGGAQPRTLPHPAAGKRQQVCGERALGNRQQAAGIPNKVLRQKSPLPKTTNSTPKPVPICVGQGCPDTYGNGSRNQPKVRHKVKRAPPKRQQIQAKGEAQHTPSGRCRCLCPAACCLSHPL